MQNSLPIIQFINSVAHKWQLPKDQKPEVLIVGRSNAGKSTLLNKISKAKVAQTSKQPGRTRLLNFFQVGEAGYIVDLPGIGYAKAAKSIQSSWQQSVDMYFKQKRNIVGIIQVMDIRHIYTKHDAVLADFIQKYPNITILNKADKLSKNGANKQINLAKHFIKSNNYQTSFLLHSSIKNIGTKAICEKIYAWINA